PVHQVNVKSRAQIESVTYRNNNTGREDTVYGTKIILASGAYNVPKLLMASTNDFWENGIGNDYDLVGRYVVSHSMLIATGTAKENLKGWFQEYDFPTLMSRSYDTKEHQKKGKIFIFKNRKYPKTDIAQLMIEGKTRAEIDDIVYGKMTIQIQAFLEEKGKHENRLTAKNGLDRLGLPQLDRFGLPQTEIKFNRTDEDTKNAKDRLDILRSIIIKMGLEIDESRTFVQDPGGHHTTGTARMGTSPDNSVTDKQMKVHETNNLYVCSNAAFPTGTAVNPTLTLTAMALRLVDHLITESNPDNQKENEYDNSKRRVLSATSI
ncbi:MAG: GMC family oxidoreductase, partial [Flavobacteriales bacterium]|nr:GMC family oxidoreductase [Flavobacteriales bacterium]